MTVEKAFTEANNQARTILITVQICKKKKKQKGNPGNGGWVANSVKM